MINLKGDGPEDLQGSIRDFSHYTMRSMALVSAGAFVLLGVLMVARSFKAQWIADSLGWMGVGGFGFLTAALLTSTKDWK